MKIEWSQTPTTQIPSAPLQQHPNYGAAIKSLGRRVEWANLVDNGTTIGFAQFIVRQPCRIGGFAFLPRGPILANGPTTNIMPSLVFHLLQNSPITGLRATIINPECGQYRSTLTKSGFTQIITPQHIGEIDLTATKSARLESQTIKWRNRLRAAQKTRLKIIHRPFPNEANHPIFAAETYQRRAKKYRALPHSFTRAYIRANPNATRLFDAILDGTPVASMFFLLHGSVATYHMGWSNMSGRHTNAHNLILWIATNWLAKNGFTRLDLGTVDTETAPGLARFKIGSGAVIRQLGGTWLHTPLTAPPTRLMARISTATIPKPH